ncbi:MAG: thiamine diphosphokinase [Kiritimatiellia bacterium]
MRAVLVLNGEAPLPERLRELASEAPVYAADGGAGACLDAGIRPEWVAGDMDSASSRSLPSDWKIIRVPEQDRTDFQKVLDRLPAEIGELRILGGLGCRLDHMITNLLIASELPADMRVEFESSDCRVFRVSPACPLRQEFLPGTTLSLLPLERVEGVRTQGLKWNLAEQTMGQGIQLGQSNLVEGPVEIELRSGNLFVWVGLQQPSN